VWHVAFCGGEHPAERGAEEERHESELAPWLSHGKNNGAMISTVGGQADLESDVTRWSRALGLLSYTSRRQ